VNKTLFPQSLTNWSYCSSSYHLFMAELVTEKGLA
jgi:hypothetical protein